MNMLVLGGFLGSGKTSVLLQLAKHIIGEGSDKYAKVVILENEIGEVSVDDKILRSKGYTVENMFSGCVCCTMSGEMVINVKKIMADLRPDWIIMEATGVAYPYTIVETLQSSIKDIEMKVVVLADSKRWNRLLIPMRQLISDQLNGADFILINKIDMVDDDTLMQVDRSVESFNAKAQRFHINAHDAISEQVLHTLTDWSKQEA